MNMVRHRIRLNENYGMQPHLSCAPRDAGTSVEQGGGAEKR